MKIMHSIMMGFALLVNLALAVEQPSDTAQLTHPALFDTALAQRVILVTFADATINRPSISTPFNRYRQRAKYQSSTWSLRISEQLAEQYHLTQLSAWPISELGVYCIAFLVAETDSVPQIITQLSIDERVDLVQKIQFYQTKAHHYSDPYFKLQTPIQEMKIAELHQHSTGQNIKIALIDTGIDLTHPDLHGQAIETRNYVSEVSPTFSEDMHGTAVAGVMVALADNNTGIVGIAPDASLLALKACWPLVSNEIDAMCNSFTLALAINSAIKLGANVLNLSLTGAYDPLIEQLLKQAIAKRIVVVVADSRQETEHGNFPASMSDVIAVHSIESVNHSDTESHSLSAPGKEILTTLPQGTYDFISGSSLSAAHISGIVALLLEHDNKIDTKQLGALLRTTSPSNLLTLFTQD